jgi:hypothetical protein
MILDEFRKNNIWNWSWHVAIQDGRNLITWKKNSVRLRNEWSRGHLACWQCIVYTMRVLLVELLLMAHMSYTHAGREKLARGFFLLHACWTSWLSSRRAREWLGTGKAKEESKEKTTGRVGRARGCSWAAHLVVRRQSSPAHAHGRIRYTRGKWSEWRAERAAAGEKPGVPFCRPGRGLCHQLAFGVHSHATMMLQGWWTVVGGAACSRERWFSTCTAGA